MKNSINLVATYQKFLNIGMTYEFFSEKVSVWPILIILEDLP